MPESKHIGKYELLDELGSGGFAVVYKARDTVLDRIVALKVLHAHVAENVTFVQRFEQEARTAAGFDHPQIVTIFEVGEEAGQHYIAMNYLPGRGLDEALAEADGPLPLEQVIAVVAQVADALDYIHQRGSVHRDVKPSNVRLSDEGHATLLDFGIVRAADGTRLTTTGETMGTPQYMSPEQAEGQEIDHRSDIYSLGVMAYQMCTGKAPFDDVSPLVVLRLHTDRAPPPPRELNPDLPSSVEQVLLRALVKRADKRYQSAGDFARALQEAEAGLQRARAERERQDRLAQLYGRLRAADAGEDWIEVLALVGQIEALGDTAYRDVPELKDTARRKLRRQRQPVPPWVWPVGALALVGLVVGFLWLAFGGGAAITPAREPAATPAPTSTPIPEPTEEPAPTGTPTREPSDTPGPTSAPTRETAGPPAGEPWTRPADGMVMVYVPAGTFPMGSDDEDVEYALQLCNEYGGGCDRSWFEDQQPMHDVRLDGFWIDQTELTNAQYALCVADGECRESDYADDADFNGDDYPVVGVSWRDAVAYCEWAGARLPTEAEWECAAGGPEGHLYPWGDDDPACDLAQYWGCSGRTVPVGGLPDGASWCGALEMTGNVWEWVADWYGDYPSGPQTSPTGPETGQYRVLRGGAWSGGPEWVRGASRMGQDPGGSSNDFGFRCARGSQ